ncbi:MAG: ATP-binding protein, partial [Acidimicrobiia bacterium]
MKCTRCRGRAVLDLARHNAAFCTPCLVHYTQEQVRRAIADYEMMPTDARVLVAVSGGKDSLALWHLLRTLGYEADGVYLDLGISEYSAASTTTVRAFAEQHGWPLRIIALREEFGFDIPGAADATARPACAACGISKRHLFDRAALDGGYDVIATGHNLDDEAAVLLGNVLRWEMDALARQTPVLPARPGFPRKIKPLVRLQEREMAAYCVVSGIEYIVEECPM